MAHPVRALITVVAAVLVAPAAAALAAPPPASTAPGRVLLDTTGGTLLPTVDGGGARFAAVLPDGGALLLAGAVGPPNTASLVHIDRRGLPVGDAVPVDLRSPPRMLLQLLRRPDGRLLLIANAPGDAMGTGELLVTQLNADGTLDRSFGTDGVATTGIDIGCGACTTAALDAQGRIVLTGTTGRISPTPPPGDYSGLRWAVVRLTAGGARDTSFGDGGITTLAPAGASGFNVAVLPDGRIVSEAQQVVQLATSHLLLARLLPDGSLDPSFGGGGPVQTELATGFPMLAGADGSVLVAGHQQGMTTPPYTPGTAEVVRYTASGAKDPSFATNGLTAAGDVQQLLAAPAGGTLVVVRDAGVVRVTRLGADGAPDPAFTGRALPLTFGGGGSSVLVSKRPRPLPSLRQNSFGTFGVLLLPRADGSFLVPGGVDVTQPTGEGAGYSTFRVAAVSLTSSLSLDPAFGGTQEPLHVGVSLLRQRGRTAYERHGIRVRLRLSQIGLARVKIRAGGHTIAQSVLPAFTTRTRTLPVELTTTGNRMLRHRHRPLRVSVAVTGRDVLTDLGTASARGTLR